VILVGLLCEINEYEFAIVQRLIDAGFVVIAADDPRLHREGDHD